MFDFEQNLKTITPYEVALEDFLELSTSLEEDSKELEKIITLHSSLEHYYQTLRSLKGEEADPITLEVYQVGLEHYKSYPYFNDLSFISLEGYFDDPRYAISYSLEADFKAMGKALQQNAQKLFKMIFNKGKAHVLKAKVLIKTLLYRVNKTLKTVEEGESSNSNNLRALEENEIKKYRKIFHPANVEARDVLETISFVSSSVTQANVQAGEKFISRLNEFLKKLKDIVVKNEDGTSAIKELVNSYNDILGTEEKDPSLDLAKAIFPSLKFDEAGKRASLMEGVEESTPTSDVFPLGYAFYSAPFTVGLQGSTPKVNAAQINGQNIDQAVKESVEKATGLKVKFLGFSSVIAKDLDVERKEDPSLKNSSDGVKALEDIVAGLEALDQKESDFLSLLKEIDKVGGDVIKQLKDAASKAKNKVTSKTTSTTSKPSPKPAESSSSSPSSESFYSFSLEDTTPSQEDAPKKEESSPKKDDSSKDSSLFNKIVKEFQKALSKLVSALTDFFKMTLMTFSKTYDVIRAQLGIGKSKKEEKEDKKNEEENKEEGTEE